MRGRRTAGPRSSCRRVRTSPRWRSCCWPTRPIPMPRQRRPDTASHCSQRREARDWSSCCWPTKPIPMSETTAGQTPLDCAKKQCRESSRQPGICLWRAQAYPGRGSVQPPGAVMPPVPLHSQRRSLRPWLTCCAGMARQTTCRRSTGSASRAARRGIRTTCSTKGTNDWNQFTLLDLLGVHYWFLAASPNEGGREMVVQRVPSFLPPQVAPPVCVSLTSRTCAFAGPLLI